MSTRPADIQTPLHWYREDRSDGFAVYALSNPERHWPPCEVYWGTHGCARPRGHEGDHWCDCCECDDHPDDESGCVAGPPYYGPDTHFYGDDVEPSQA